MEKLNGALHDANTDAKIELSDDSKAAVLRTINEALGQLALIRDMTNDGKLMKSDMETYLTLAKHRMDDMAKATGMEWHADAELEETREWLREANREIRRLQLDIGRNASARNTTAAVQYYERAFTAWYKTVGFRYASVEYSPYGLVAAFSSEIENKREARNDERIPAGLTEKLALVGYEFTNAKYDMRDEQYHKELLDTDRNRKNLCRLFYETFPGSRMYGFSSMSDRNQFTLRAKVFVGFNEIEDWMPKATEETKEEKD